MNKIIETINKGLLVGCGGSSRSSNSIIAIPIIILNNPIIYFNNVKFLQNNNKLYTNNIPDKIITKDQDIDLILEYDRNIIFPENSRPFVTISELITLQYDSGNGTNRLVFKKTLNDNDPNVTDVEINFYSNNTEFKDDDDNILNLNFMDIAVAGISIYLKYEITNEYTNNPGLNLHNTLYAYQNEIHGSNIIIGVIDSGLDKNHSDFNNKIIDGKDYGNENFLIKNTGNHGSHVGGIISANNDNTNLGMHGYSFLSKLVDYRVFNNDGYWTASDLEMGQMSDDAVNKNIKIMNNSWGYELHYIDGKKKNLGVWEDYNVNTFLSYQEVNGYLNSGLNNNIINVFAAGNDSYINPGIMAGLPAIYKDISQLWVSVISLDAYGKESYYTNRAGIANKWSISAHGGDYFTDQSVLSIESNGTYTRKQGTSMASPVVSGCLALIMNKFPNLSPQLCLDRMFQTATYEGLKAGVSDNTNILVKTYDRDKFTQYKDSQDLTLEQKQQIFGYGKIDIEAALQDMNDQQLEELNQFSINRRDEIHNVSVNNIEKTGKFINSFNKQRILF